MNADSQFQTWRNLDNFDKSRGSKNINLKLFIIEVD